MHFIMLTAFALNVAWCGSNHVFYLFIYFFLQMQRFLKALKARWQGKEIPFEYTFGCVKVPKPHSV